MNARQKLLQTAKSLRGQRDTVIDDYNRLAKPLPLGYRVKYEDMGCAVYVSVPFLLPLLTRLKQTTEAAVPAEAAAEKPAQLPAADDPEQEGEST